ncbi:MAG TPA: ABC transporter ATP-binding protein [Streptosporangiaceae bacterium]|nr:ABC transporter ATP-binding protein [Streptosporangiaceae bacterium]
MSAAPALADAALQVDNLRVCYAGLPAVDDVSLRVEPGQVAALIGETSSGKSSLALGVARLLPSSAVVTGRVTIAGADLAELPGREARRRRAGLVGYIAQDAMAALNPVLPVGRQIGELFRMHRGMSRADASRQAVRELARVRIDRPERVAGAYPHQLSGGMRQRVMIAMAMALSPPLLIADEPTTALDVSTQAEILHLVGELQAETGSGILWITHDMGVVAELADWIAVMYAGRIVEQGPADEVFDHPAHPYTEALLRTRRDLRTGRPGALLYQIEGSPPALSADRRGCAFAPRCPRRSEICDERPPDLTAVRPGGSPEAALPEAQVPTAPWLAACHHPEVSP